MAAGEFSRLLVSHWRELHEKLRSQDEEIIIDGRSLSVASVVVCSRYGQSVAISEETAETIRRHTEMKYGELREGETMSGSWRPLSYDSAAPIKVTAVEHFQRAMVRDSHYGILSGDTDLDITHATRAFSSAIPLLDPMESTTMPESWVRAQMLVRANMLAYPSVGIRPSLLKKLAQLLNMDVVPRVPLRGSISGVGDMATHSYVGSVLAGKPSVQAWIGDRIQGGRRLVPADEALSYAEIEPTEMRAKEGLALLVGTSASAGIGSLAVHEAMCLAATAQVATAMAAEALCVADMCFHPMLSEVRPHGGQTECATNLRSFIEGSKLIVWESAKDEFMARSDRYAVRTSPQWLGPCLEDLGLAHSQILIELNSATDTPLIDPSSGQMIHGGNFMAKSLTSATEKIRQVCQSIGQILFAQCTEIINPTTNKGLPPYLVVDEPSQSGLFKSTDTLVAALQSELGFLGNPVGTHVQFAEMGFQAINSLSLISTRYTLTALDVLTQLAAAHIVALCQALDLRALHLQFLYALAPKFKFLTRRCLSECTNPTTPSIDEPGAEIAYDLWLSLSDRIHTTMHLDSRARFASALDYLQTSFLRYLPANSRSLEAVQQWNADCVHEACATYSTVRTRYLAKPDATPILGKASARCYAFVRKKLEIPFVGNDYFIQAERDDGTRLGSRVKYKTMGSMNSAVYESMRNGSFYGVIVECFEEV
ncbi:phenylalanine ammonia-lyase-like protein [Bimuria novae-zelandiae CBS 107.79]|uniref:Phenylalanine ammonia-lyase-like protein n=1 Tax=Bimuria novae-zelandiae CBS 107.79 TaxID=1447943 RepID=A0A6A5UWS4_9PLEO|nr:phenylalanine ammonia-lyase-like protein [Bimuria novae-zelandiae CBS 107.79]